MTRGPEPTTRLTARGPEAALAAPRKGKRSSRRPPPITVWCFAGCGDLRALAADEAGSSLPAELGP